MDQCPNGLKTSKAIEQALRDHASGNLQQAEALYREVLRLEPENAEALHLLGVIAYQVKRHELALKLIRRAIDIDGAQTRYHNALGVALMALGKRDEAVASYRQALALQSEFGEAHNNLGNALREKGELDEAIACYRRALELNPNIVEAHNNLGNVLKLKGDLAEAVACFQRALALKPGYGEAYSNLGNALEEMDRLDEAVECCRRAISLKPDFAEAYGNLGNALNKLGRSKEAIAAHRKAIALRPDFALGHNSLGVVLFAADRLNEAIVSYERAIALDPNLAVAHNNLGSVLEVQERFDQALQCYRRAISLKPDYADAYNSLGKALTKLGQLGEATAAYERAIALNPNHALAHTNRSFLLLIQGELERGWREYEWRLADVPQAKAGTAPFAQPRWGGESLAGRALLIHAEQGLGDQIMFSSILPEIVREADACLIECSPKLEKLFRRSFPEAMVLSNERNVAGWEGRLTDWLRDMGEPDVQSPIGSVALYRRRSLADFPKHRGYLKADAARVGYWRSRLTELGRGLKVGISWRGGRADTGRARRSMSLSQLLPVLRQREVRFVSLQYTDCREEIWQFVAETGIEIVHWHEAIDDYDDTAALVKALDLVLSVCTAVIHLGGALGQRTWVMAPHVPEWRYGVSGETMPWYPAVRIFRQPAPGDWDSVLKRVSEQLRKLKD